MTVSNINVIDSDGWRKTFCFTNNNIVGCELSFISDLLIYF